MTGATATTDMFRFADLDWRSGHPQTAAWFGKQSQRPSVQKTAPVDDQ